MNNESNSSNKLGLFGLIAVVVGSMLGGGVFSLPQNTAENSAVGPIIIAWIISGIGVFFIANAFKILSSTRSDLKTGIYMYAHEGYGPFIGFIVAWGYWLMTCFGNVAFAVIIMDSMNYFFPGVFTGGNNLTSIICGSLLIWGYNFIVLSGTRIAGAINLIGTIAKMIPLLAFVIIVGVSMNYHQLTTDFWGEKVVHSASTSVSITSQIMSPMIVALWAFIGIEGAVVLSDKAKNQSDIGKATIIGFILALVVFILLSILPFGIAPQSALRNIENPSTAGVLSMIVGNWGAWLMNVGLIISVLASWLAWTMLCAELPSVAAKNGTFPKAFANTNKNGASNVSLWVSSFVMQATIILVYFSNNAWNTMLSITTVMVLPAYLTTTLFLCKMCLSEKYSSYKLKNNIPALTSGIFGTIFCLFMFYAGNLKYVVMIPLLLTVGLPFFIWGHKEKKTNTSMFSKTEGIYLAILLILDVLVLLSLYFGYLKF